MERVKEIFKGLNHNCIVSHPPALEADIERVNRELHGLGLEPLPLGLVDFFKICSGFEFNGVVIYGTYESQIVSHNEDRHDYYDEFPHLLFFGSIDDDIYTYNISTRRYESRDINGMECWEEYDTFEAFFFGEIMQWLE